MSGASTLLHRRSHQAPISPAAPISQTAKDPAGGEDASSPLARNRRHLQVALGVIWLIDAGLQFQPFMFTKSFVVRTLESTVQGNPSVIAQPMLWADHFMVHEVAVWNSLFALVQLLIAIGLFWRPTVRLALAGSVIWSLGVWWIGEGLGGVLSGATPVTGAPGAVILYALVAVLLYPPRVGRRHAPMNDPLLSAKAVQQLSLAEGADIRATSPISVGRSSRLGELAPNALWALLWGSFAYLLLLPANRAPQGLHNTVAGMASGEPGWIRSLDSGLASAVSQHGTQASGILAVLCLFVAVGVFFPALVRPAVVVAIAVSLAFWMVEDFGGILTSQGTDVNSGPALVLLALVYWPVAGTLRSRAAAFPRTPARATLPALPALPV
jgi:hypothetical protein